MERASTVPAKKAASESGSRYYLGYLRSLLFTNPLIYFYTAACGTASLIGSIFDGSGRWQHGCAKFWSWLILKTGRVRVRVEGLENVPRNQTVVFCVNHQSALDIPILFVHLPVRFRFLAKRSLFHLPFLGWHLRRSGHIPVERERPHEALRSLELASQRIRTGSPVVLFPEGHRSRDGQLRPFKGGSFYLAIKAGVPIVPITLNGTRHTLKPDTYYVRGGQTEMIVHPPVPTAGLGLDSVEELRAEVRERIVSRFLPPAE
jgi:1-acyl-sn-glycerol-3-phosphate acyltransferase